VAPVHGVEPHAIGRELVKVRVSITPELNLIRQPAVAVAGPHPCLTRPPLAVDLDLDVGRLERFVDVKFGHRRTVIARADRTTPSGGIVRRAFGCSGWPYASPVSDEPGSDGPGWEIPLAILIGLVAAIWIGWQERDPAVAIGTFLFVAFLAALFLVGGMRK
jgi:hypothetical protein